MTKEGNGEKVGEIIILSSSLFTDPDDPQSAERFKALMQFQYGFSDKQVEQSLELLRKQERWKAEGDFHLLEITDPEHEYLGRIGQLMGAMSGSFVGNRPSYQVDAEEVLAGAKIEQKLCLVVKVDLSLVQLAEGGGQYRLLNKFELAAEEIEVEDEDGKVGTVLGWRKNEQEGLSFGFYTAEFGDEVREKDDFLMMQEPTWQFRRAGIKR